MLNLVEPGDTVIVGVCGFFGRRIAEKARRAGAEVVEVEADWGEVVPTDRIAEALERSPEARLLAVVHAETSTGVEQPVADLAALVAATDALLMVDCVTSLGGVPLEVGRWGIDYAYSCTQKCLAAPPGMSPIAVSERALARVRERTHPVPFSFDLELLERYWVERPAVYHHTAPILHIYALHEALRLALDEGLERRWERHAEAGAHLRRRADRTRARPARRPGSPPGPADRRPAPRGRRREGRANADAARARDRDRRRARSPGAADVADSG